MNRLILSVIAILLAKVIFAQNNDCLEDFNYLVNRIKNDYPGYSDKVNEENYIELKQLEENLRININQYPDSCRIYFNRYTSWFKDHHLRVSNNQQNYKFKETEQFEKKYYDIDINKLSKTSETLEGIWVGFRGNFAIIGQDKGRFTGVAIDYIDYEKNQILFDFIDVGNNEYELITFRDYNNYSPAKEKASLHLNNSVLEIHGDTRYVRQSKDPAFDMALLMSYFPKYPNGLNTYPVATYLGDSTYYLRIPNFYSNLTDELVTKHWEEIMSRPNLIIDIRNNGGGQDNYYQKLAELCYTDPYESKGVEWYSTEGIIADWEDDIKNGRIKKGYEQNSKDLVNEMKKNIGGFVLNPNYVNDEIVERDTIYLYPKKVGIIINKNDASSAEQFLLAAKHSSKVTLFGNENTAGVLDYSNITPKELPSGKYYLWLPATRSRRLPDYPIDNIGIAPDIIIPLMPQEQLFNRLDDWVYFVKNYLEYNE
ncbi:MAG: hypothetical protein GXO79_03350 [Chlorobi bacterium]|nr:hypothetical protein [Chlorobiota bacterium]